MKENDVKYCNQKVRELQEYLREKTDCKTIQLSMILDVEAVKASTVNEIIDPITKICSDICNQTIEMIKSQTRVREVCNVRNIIVYLVRKYYKNQLSLSTIGLYFGGRDHATILNCVKKFDQYYSTEQSYRHTANQCEEEFIKLHKCLLPCFRDTK